jgi:hypothetical protein
LIDASCVDITNGPPAHVFPGNPRDLPVGVVVGELEGDSVTFTMSHDEVDQVIACIFVNAPVPESGVGGETATLPPTDTSSGRSGPAIESWRMVMVVMGGLLASVLILTPDRADRRASYGNEGDSRAAAFLDRSPTSEMAGCDQRGVW